MESNTKLAGNFFLVTVSNAALLPKKLPTTSDILLSSINKNNSSAAQSENSNSMPEFFDVLQETERESKCGVQISCVKKNNKLSTVALNAHLRFKNGNQLDVEASLLISDIEKMENPTPRAQITSMFLKVTKNDITVDGYDRNSAKFTDLTRSLFHQQTHAKLADNVAEDVFFPQRVMETEQTDYVLSTSLSLYIRQSSSLV